MVSQLGAAEDGLQGTAGTKAAAKRAQGLALVNFVFFFKTA